jgi:hypothetical protein
MVGTDDRHMDKPLAPADTDTTFNLIGVPAWVWARSSFTSPRSRRSRQPARLHVAGAVRVSSAHGAVRRPPAAATLTNLR